MPLAELYEKSTLEQMHYSLMMQLMRHHGLGTLLDRPESGSCFRKLLAMTVLATDMGIHADFMARFKEMVSGAPVDRFTQKILVCQALIKCADISNPVCGTRGYLALLLTAFDRAARIRSRNIGPPR